MHPLGLVPTDGRGSLPYALVHGESLVAAASWALTTAGVELFDYSVSFEAVQESGRPLVVHDPLCPLTPAGFIEEAVAESERTGAVVVGVRPGDRHVKEYDGATLGATVDRGGPRLRHLTGRAPGCRGRGARRSSTPTTSPPWSPGSPSASRCVTCQAPPLGRRIVGEADLEVLVALSRAG